MFVTEPAAVVILFACAIEFLCKLFTEIARFAAQVPRLGSGARCALGAKGFESGRKEPSIQAIRHGEHPTERVLCSRWKVCTRGRSSATLPL
jgi:hypothetical protein